MKKSTAISAGLSLFALCAQTATAAEIYGDIGVNAQLEASGANVRLAYAEFIVSTESSYDTMKVVFFKDTGNKQLPAHWVPGDPRNDVGQGPAMLYITDTVDGVANCGEGCEISADETTAAIDSGMAEWDAIDCSDLPIVNVGAYAEDFGYVQNLVGFGGSGGFFPFITHGGWLPKEFFDAIGGPGGGDGILGVTFTFIWGDVVDGVFIPSDIDSNRKADVALREIYMNNNFLWEIGNDKGRGFFDVKAVMNHEQGHALSQAHFGSISLMPSGKVVWTPKDGDNVMLAAISSNQLFEGFQGTDIGGHCSIWSTWPIQ